jgi:hypothetical protein
LAPERQRSASRIHRRYQVRFSGGHQTLLGFTGDLSENGMQILTHRPYVKGARLQIDLHTPGGVLQLTGVVRRVDPHGLRDFMMGIELIRPDLLYVGFVRSLRNPAGEPSTAS